jgi:hypothetical protein
MNSLFKIVLFASESVQLDEELEVHVLGLGRGARLLLVAPAGLDIDPLLISGWVEERGRRQRVTRKIWGTAVGQLVEKTLKAAVESARWTTAPGTTRRTRRASIATRDASSSR